MYKNFIKPVIDFVLALVGFLFLSPVFVMVTIGLFFANDGKPFFFQLRPGKNGKIFKIIKFISKNYLVLKESVTSKMAQNFVLANNFS